MKTLSAILVLSLLTIAKTTPAEEHFDSLLVTNHLFVDGTLSALNAKEGIIRSGPYAGKVKLSDLPEPYRSRYYNPDKAKAAEDAEARKLEQRKQAAAAAQSAAIEGYKQTNFRLIDGKPVKLTLFQDLDGQVEAVKTNGVVLRLYTTVRVMVPRAPTYGPSSYGNFIGGSGAYASVQSSYPKRVLGDESAFVLCNPALKNYHDSEDVLIHALEKGTTNLPDGRTLRLFDAGAPYVSQTP